MLFRLIPFLLMLFLTGCEDEILLSKGTISQLGNKGVLIGHFSQDGSKLVTVDSTNTLTVWDSKSMTELFSVPKDKMPELSRDVVLSKDNNMLIVVGDNLLQFWSLSTEKLVTKVSFTGVSGYAHITSVSLSPSMDKIIVAMSDGTVNMAHLHTQVNNQFAPHSRPVMHVEWDDKGELFLTAAQDGKLALWQFGSPEPVFTKEFNHRVTSLAVRKDFSEFFVSDALDNQVIASLIDGADKSELKYMARFKVFRKALFIEKSRLLATSSSKSQLTIWDTQSGNELGTWQINTVNSGATIVDMYAPTKEKLVTLSSDGLLEEWALNMLANRK
ncbi:WD40 repeat domain-containing protein [Pseudoalteromonas luteoviolacea]|uniref:Anaphase-promoting complex subunit 4-like WD40 domain-containing protein n=1 Tax=Pseudoalteromonas luteoviolacea S4054 TaxID=1129367 RepID=A0A0F6A7P5_9GAMM|nr:hypothetical protein [Pseudoalteromonas luteoviolacea]AOT10468.1 hypothetical protein S4054249_21605 [Pseudoalteromonas luteoviolacea]AOT15463.1 hypothetical protein S40542_21990 [Pseudoalteromonas luteoviolacea]AOT20287.1 hypothetical protein S4054_21520 [Pseudoalteromonas luteoviolacea]KKE81414.1 hypothetical protein N479_02730 [Pseudoalteromonas luteoviolacea S4054]KZN71689.1 hypothetical protein N481_18650 [Pseudoalteromonas luteoviolacea S4047-1]